MHPLSSMKDIRQLGKFRNFPPPFHNVIQKYQQQIINRKGNHADDENVHNDVDNSDIYGEHQH